MSDVTESLPQQRLQSGMYARAKNGAQTRTHIKRDRRIERLANDIKQEMPWLKGSDMRAARAFAELEFLARQAYSCLIVAGLTNNAGESRREFNQRLALAGRRAKEDDANGKG